MNNYQKKVKEAREEFLKVMANQEKELVKIYVEASKIIEDKLKRAPSGGITERYYKALKVSLDRYVKELRKELKSNIENNIDKVSNIATEIQTSFFDQIAPTLKLKQSFESMFTQISKDTVKRMLEGKYYSDGKTLDDRLWILTSKNAKDIERLITLNMASGTNARELAKLLDRYINPKKILLKRNMADKIDKHISYQAARLARTSLTHAYSETLIEDTMKNPFSTGLKWNTSPAHYERQIKKYGEDMCTWNNGKVFKPKTIPLQHPNCLCYFTVETVPVEEARKELVAWVNGKEDKVLDSWLNKYGKEYGIEV